MENKTKLAKKAKIAYTYFTDTHPTIHSNRFASWRELSAERKQYWQETEENACKGYAHFVSIQPYEARKKMKSWNKISQAERQIWRMTEQKARQLFENEETIGDKIPARIKWHQLHISIRHKYRMKAMMVEGA